MVAVDDRPAIDTELDPERAAALIAAGAQVVDVRRAYEFEGGHVAGARNIEINDLTAAAASIERRRPVLFSCRTGDRSGMAAQAFREAGYDAYNQAGGMVAWIDAGQPLEPEGGSIVAPLPPSSDRPDDG